MTNRNISILGLTLAVLLLSACSPTQIPQHLPALPLPSVPPLAVPTVSAPAIPPITVPTIALPPIVLPTVNAPAIGLTMVNGAISTSAAPASTPAPAVPVTGGSAPDAAKWLLYGLVTLIGVAVVILAFARYIRRTDNRNKTDRPQHW